MQTSTFLTQRKREKFLNHKLTDFQSSLPQSILNIQEKNRSNIFNWRGQFSPQLIENLILNYCPRNAHVFDPFVGSGTVLYESACFGLSASGCEVNPAAWILSRTYQLMNLPLTQRKQLIKQVHNKFSDYFAQPVLFELDNTKELEISDFQESLFKIYSHSDEHEKIILDTLAILLDIGNSKLSRQHLYYNLNKISDILTNLPYSELKINTVHCDARCLKLASDSVDFVITSPPYINVFNYHQNYRRSAEILGWDLLKIAKSEIGSNRANRRNRFLTVIQYCLDMTLVLKELQRVCKPYSRVIFVIGHESNVLGVPFSNTQIISEIAVKSEMFTIVNHQSRVFKNKFGKLIVEDLLNLSSNEFNTNNINLDEIARKIAFQTLNLGLDIVAPKNQSALKEAIDKIPNTEKSPILNISTQI